MTAPRSTLEYSAGDPGDMSERPAPLASRVTPAGPNRQEIAVLCSPGKTRRSPR
jgi:hypothetical protein